MMRIKLGIYRHYKNLFYEVIGVARHSETLEPLVVYKALYKGRFPKNSLWVRPLSMFKEKIILDGKRILRFKYVGKAC